MEGRSFPGYDLSDEHSVLKFFGHCNGIDREMRKCLKKEYEANRAKSHEHAKEMKRRLREAGAQN